MSSTTFDASNSTAMGPATTDNTKVDEAVGNLAIDLSSLDATWWNNVTADGSDIRVTDDTGTKFGSETAYSMELENFDKNNQTGWLFIDSSAHIATSVDKTFRVYCGDTSLSAPADSDTLGAENVWSSQYALVSHDGGGTDSTSNGNGGTANGGVTAGGVTGKVGGATDFDGDDDLFDIDGIETDINKSNDYSVSFWFKADDTADSGGVMFDSTTGGHDRNVARLDSGTIRFNIYNGSWENKNIASGYFSDETSFHYFFATHDLSASSDAVRAWVDNSELTGTNYNGASKNIGASIGGSTNGYSQFDGKLDEVRVVTTKLSTGWKSTEYNNQNDNASFFTFGATETPSADVTVNTGTPTVDVAAQQETVSTQEAVTYFASSVILDAVPIAETVTTYKEISGNVTLSGNNVQGAVMTLINSDNDTLVSTTTTDSNGNYSFQAQTGSTFHVTVEYDDGTNKHNAKSKPYLTA